MSKAIRVARIRFDGKKQVVGKSGCSNLESRDVKGGKGYHTLEYWPFPWDKFRIKYEPPAKAVPTMVQFIEPSQVQGWEPLDDVSFGQGVPQKKG